MRKRIYGSTLVAVMLLAGCSRQSDKTRIQATEEEPPQLASAVHMADTRTAPQLVKGFYPLEQNAWRWTKGAFAVKLRAPLAAAQKGATLDLKFTVPEPVLEKLQHMTLSASVNGTALTPETFSKAGPATYRQDVPPAAFTGGDEVNVDFTLDRALPPSAADARELGLVVSSVALEAK